jgi:hypothetical protein
MPPPANLFDGMTGELPPGTKMVKLLPILLGHASLSRPLWAQECENTNGEAIMEDMIYEGADKEEGDYTEYDGTEYEDVHEGYSINEQTLFGNDDYTQDMVGEIIQATAATLSASLVATLADDKKISQRMESYIVEGTTCYALLGLRFPKTTLWCRAKGQYLLKPCEQLLP